MSNQGSCVCKIPGCSLPLFSTLKTAPIFRQAVIDAVAKTDYDGVLGHQSFDANGDTINHSLSLYQFTDVNGPFTWKYLTMQAVPVPPGWNYDPLVSKL